MQDTNTVLVTGRLTRDPEGRRTNSGTAVTELGVASNGRKKDQTGNWVDDPCFLDVTVWGKSAEFCRDYLKKGSRVLIEGRLQLDQWEDRTTGQKRSKLKVVAQSVQSLDPPPQRDQQPQQGYSQPQQNSAPPPPNVPPPFPTDNANTQQAPPPPRTADDSNAFDVTEESIDDIPF